MWMGVEYFRRAGQDKQSAGERCREDKQCLDLHSPFQDNPGICGGMLLMVIHFGVKNWLITRADGLLVPWLL